MSKLKIALVLALLVAAGLFFLDAAKHQRAGRKLSPVATSQSGLRPSKNVADLLVKDDIRIKDFGITNSGAEIKNFLGEPAQRQQRLGLKQLPGNLTYIDTWTYPGIELLFSTGVPKSDPPPKDPSNLIKMVITSDQYPTKRGIKVGDPLSKVLKLYGNAPREADHYTYGYAYIVLIRFTVTGDTVSKIEIGGEPD